jgi:F0F1-type ATP synthase membrane subunit c/vacuolar-type H+-ATPase subunit K
MSKDYNERRIRVEIELENNAATWMRQMVTTISIAIAVLAYFEIKGNITSSPIAMFSVGLLLLTSIVTGVMSSLAYRRRKDVLIKDGILTDDIMNRWYLIVGITSVVGFIGVGIAVVRNKTKHN